MIVVDASAVLAWLGDELGADVVEAATAAGGPLTCSAVNWSEVVQKAVARGVALDDVAAAVTLLRLSVVDVGREDAERAAHLWLDHPSLSLADRLCLALADRLDADALTADQAWAAHPRARLIR